MNKIEIFFKRVFRKSIHNLLIDYMIDRLNVDEKYEYQKVISGEYSTSVFGDSFRINLELSGFVLMYQFSSNSYSIIMLDANNNNEVFRVSKFYLDTKTFGKLTKDEVRQLIEDNKNKIRISITYTAAAKQIKRDNFEKELDKIIDN